LFDPERGWYQLPVKRLADAVNVLVEAKSDSQVRVFARRITPKKVGTIVRKDLGLHTERSSDGHDRAYQVVYDAAVVDRLRETFGITDAQVEEIEVELSIVSAD